MLSTIATMIACSTAGFAPSPHSVASATASGVAHRSLTPIHHPQHVAPPIMVPELPVGLALSPAIGKAAGATLATVLPRPLQAPLAVLAFPCAVLLVAPQLADLFSSTLNRLAMVIFQLAASLERMRHLALAFANAPYYAGAPTPLQGVQHQATDQAKNY